uniref:Rab3 GTPase-activating protein catalytic subunit n=1 Tax=Angiostrongylus cantonensis TaxID=6313 RepID=A0A0K0CVY5_ANGCA
FHSAVFCRQGRSYSHEVQSATQCPSSTTACGFFEFKSPDLERGVDNIGVYECVDNGILQSNANDVDEDNLLFTQLCGATPQCSHLNLNKLNTLFAKYLFVHHHIQLELLTSHTIRFCCSLFHHTLQKLVTSGKDRLQYFVNKILFFYFSLFPSAIPAPPIHCESEMCEKDAVGCLLHSHAANEESDEYYDDDDDDHGNDHDNNYETRETTALRQVGVSIIGHFERLLINSMDMCLTKEIATVNYNKTRSERLSKLTNDISEKLDDTDEVHCVYRHLNDELYRYCLLVHQGKDGDRCDSVPLSVPRERMCHPQTIFYSSFSLGETSELPVSAPNTHVQTTASYTLVSNGKHGEICGPHFPDQERAPDTATLDMTITERMLKFQNHSRPPKYRRTKVMIGNYIALSLAFQSSIEDFAMQTTRMWYNVIGLAETRRRDSFNAVYDTREEVFSEYATVEESVASAFLSTRVWQ